MKWWAVYANLLVNAIVGLPHPRSTDSQGQEMFLQPSADKQICNYDTGVLKPPSNPINTKVTLRSKGLSPRRMKSWAIYTNLSVNAIVGLSHPRSRDSQGQDTFLALSADKETHNYDTTAQTTIPINSKVKGLGP